MGIVRRLRGIKRLGGVKRFAAGVLAAATIAIAPAHASAPHIFTKDLTKSVTDIAKQTGNLRKRRDEVRSAGKRRKQDLAGAPPEPGDEREVDVETAPGHAASDVAAPLSAGADAALLDVAAWAPGGRPAPGYKQYIVTGPASSPRLEYVPKHRAEGTSEPRHRADDGDRPRHRKEPESERGAARSSGPKLSERYRYRFEGEVGPERDGPSAR